jgi:N-acylneuraminate cytidylyltransferase
VRVLAVIPARGGSKRVPRKNIRLLAGRPLLAWTIDAALQARSVSRVIVSTDDDEIAAAAGANGAEVTMRPAWAATDDAPIEAALWSVHQRVQGGYDVMVTLQPSVPIRRAGLIDECVERLVYHEAGAVFTAREVLRCWLWQEATGGDWAEHMAWSRLGPPLQRQQAAIADRLYMHDGSVCVTTRDVLETHRDRQGGRAVPVLNDSPIDIDTERDLALAEALMASMVSA